MSQKHHSPYNTRSKDKYKRDPIRKQKDQGRGLNSSTSDADTSSSQDEAESSKLESSFSSTGMSSPGPLNSSKNSKSPPPSSKGTPHIRTAGSFSNDTSFEESPIHNRKYTKRKKSIDEAKKIEKNSMPILVYIAVLVVALALFYRFIPSDAFNEVTITANLDPEERTRIQFENFQEKLKDLKSIFPKQSNTFWRIIFASLRPVIVEPEPIAPAVVMMVLPKEQHKESQTSVCLAKHILNIFTGLYNKTVESKASNIHIGQDLRHINPSKDKEELDDKLRYCFETVKGKGVILDKFESLSPIAALLLHGYCDGDNAPYKDVLFIQIVHTERSSEEISSRNDYMDTYLKALWSSELDEDKIQPLLTRVANNVAIVTSESESTLQKYCEN